MKDNQSINEQKTELFQWKRKLKEYLSNNSPKKEELFIISNYWLDKYEKYLLNENNQDINSSKIYEEYKDDNNELFGSYLESKINIKELPRIFVLNKIIWENIKNENNELNTIASIGYFDNKILILKLLETINCFFFLDNKKQIRQGYIQIINKDKEKELLLNFIKKGFKNFNDEYIEDSNKDYEIYIFKNFDKNEKNRNFKDDDVDNEIFFGKKFPRLSLKIKKLLKKDNETNIIFGRKTFKIPKNIKFNLSQKMGDVKAKIDYYKNRISHRFKENKIIKRFSKGTIEKDNKEEINIEKEM